MGLSAALGAPLFALVLVAVAAGPELTAVWMGGVGVYLAYLYVLIRRTGTRSWR